MSDLSRSGALACPPHLLDRVVARIAPFFNDGTARFTDADCRALARECVTALNPMTGKELQLAAQVSALGMAALECLRCSTQVPSDQLEAVLRMQEDALKLTNLASRAERDLDAQRRNRREGRGPQSTAAAFDEAGFNAVMSKALEMVTHARARGEASRVAQDLDLAAAVRRDDGARRKAEATWAEDLQNLSGWVRQTRH